MTVQWRKGFTLVEVIIVLSVVGVILLLSPIAKRPQPSPRLFLTQLTQLIQTAQQYAIVSQKDTTVYRDGNVISVVVSEGTPSYLAHDLAMPDSMTTDATTIVQFKGGTGNYLNGRFSRVRFFDSGQAYELVFQFGSGRFYVQYP